MIQGRVELASLDEAASAAGVSRRTLNRWIERGLLLKYRSRGDRKHYVAQADIERLMPKVVS